MKKIILSLFAPLMLAACSEDTAVEQTVNKDVLTFNLTIPTLDDMRTRADGSFVYGDGTTVSQLRYYVYNKGNGSNAEPVLSDVIPIVDTDGKRGASLLLQLPKNEYFEVVFLATACDQTIPESKIYYNSVARTLNVNYDKIQMNDEEVDCFYGVIEDVNPDEYDYSVTLKRPVAQINIGTSDLDSYNAVSDLNAVGVMMKGVYSSMDIMSGDVLGDEKTVSYSPAVMPSCHIFPKADTQYLAMNYVLVNQQKNIDVTMTASEGVDSFHSEYTPVPVKRNCQTNITGNLLTSDVDFSISIDTSWGTLVQ